MHLDTGLGQTTRQAIMETPTQLMKGKVITEKKQLPMRMIEPITIMGVQLAVVAELQVIDQTNVTQLVTG